MPALNYWTDKWDLHVDICPCDVHVNDWLAEIRGGTSSCTTSAPVPIT